MNRRMNDISDSMNKTCEWLFKHSNYLKWFNRRHELLWIKEKSEAEKSTLIKHVLAIDEWAKHAIVFAFFFFHARDSVLQKSSLDLFRSLLHQILQQISELLLKFSSIFQNRCETQRRIEKKWHWHERDLEDFFKINVADAAKTYKMRIYVDALDECGKAAVRNLVEFFTRLMKEIAFTNASLSICFSCRHYSDVVLRNELEVCIENENHDDIELYIQNIIENAVHDKKTAEVIRDEIVWKSSGNFQWIVLVLSKVVDLYRNDYSLKTIKSHIQAISSELKELYQELLKEISDEDLSHSLRLMQWICFALRSLSLEELRFATIVDANTSYQSISDCQNAEECDYAKIDEQMKKRIRHLFRDLAEVKQHENIWIAQFVHQFVKNYLIQSELQILNKHSSKIAIDHAHFQLSRSCIRYIVMKKISNQTRSYDQNLKLDFFLLQYAITSWIFHAKEIEEKNMSQDYLLVFFYSTSKLLQLWIHIYQEIEDFSVEHLFLNTKLLHVVSRYCLSSFVSTILNLDNVEANLKDANDRTSLSWVIEQKHEKIVKLLIKRDDVDTNSKDRYDRTSLSWAIIHEHKMIVKLLIERDDVEIDSKNCNDWTSLSFATEHEHETIVKLLIERDDVEMNSKDNHDQTSLSFATEYKHETIVKMLIERDDVDMNSKNDNDWTSLSLTIAHEHETIVKLLIERDDVEMNSKDRHDRTSLSQATECEHETIVKLLIEQDDVETNSKDRYDQTSLSWAIVLRHEKIVKLLIERDDVDMNSKIYNDQTPLSLAAKREHETIVKLLIERDDFEINSKNYSDRTSLSWAILKKQKTMIKLLQLASEV